MNHPPHTLRCCKYVWQQQYIPDWGLHALTDHHFSNKQNCGSASTETSKVSTPTRQHFTRNAPSGNFGSNRLTCKQEKDIVWVLRTSKGYGVSDNSTVITCMQPYRHVCAWSSYLITHVSKARMYVQAILAQHAKGIILGYKTGARNRSHYTIEHHRSQQCTPHAQTPST